MENLRESINDLVMKELVRASHEYGELFNSHHEGFAVMVEEVQEAKEESDFLLRELGELWKHIKADDESDIFLTHLNSIQIRAVSAACENIQVAAMAEKMKQTHTMIRS